VEKSDTALLGGGRMISVRLTLSHWRIAAMNELQYRANFFVQIIHSALSLAVGLVAIWLVFDHTTDLGGWTAPELLAVMGVHVLVGGLLKTLIEPNMRRLMDDVQEGTYDYVLTKPVDAQLLTSIREVKPWHAVDIVLGFGVLTYAVIDLGRTFDVGAALLFAVTLTAGTIMIYCVWIMITSTAFRVVRSDEVLNLFDGFYQTGRWPISIYPFWLSGVLTFIIPLAFAVTVPAEAVSGRLNPNTVALAVVFCVVLALVTRRVWAINLRHYSGASA